MTDTQIQAGALFIIGAGPGIGEATAERFGSAGWTIVVSSRSQSNVDGLVARLAGKGISAHGIALDASNAADLRAAIGRADQISGGLTAVLYNAANLRNQELSTISDAEIDSDIAVNISGGLHTVRVAMDLFKDRPGTILVTGGGFALSPHPSSRLCGAQRRQGRLAQSGARAGPGACGKEHPHRHRDGGDAGGARFP